MAVRGHTCDDHSDLRWGDTARIFKPMWQLADAVDHVDVLVLNRLQG